ncbi:MAG: N-6 DNA methylase [Acidobacteria bacterium]|nr:N-6 DNA methylase [Acidobacteriota bacterium]
MGVLQPRPSEASEEPKGVVYTRPWVVELILDLVGYRSRADLGALTAVEPAAGEGAFLVPMVKRLLASLGAHGRSLEEAHCALRAYELSEEAAARARDGVIAVLISSGIDLEHAREAAKGWIKVGDYLLDSPNDSRADVVVGNPPYIRYDDMPADLLARYRTAYPTMVGRGDIYIGFIEATLRQLKPGGVLGFICADRWMRSAYGIELRRLISEACAVEAVIEMHNAPAFENEVSAYPAVIVIRRASQGEALVASAGPDSGEPPEGRSLADAVIDLANAGKRMVPGFTAAKVHRWFRGGSPWPSIAPSKLELLQDLEERFAPLEDEAAGTRIGIGVATGADAVFITEDVDLVESDRLLPLAMAADTKDGTVRWSGHYLVNPWTADGTLVELERYARLRDYFESKKDQLLRRNIARRRPRDWFRTIDKVTASLLERPKLYIPDMKMTSHPTLDPGKTYPHHNLYVLTSKGWDLEVLGGLLLSRVAEFFIDAYCVKMRGGTLRFQAQYLRRIRVPDADRLSEGVRERLRQTFRSRDVEEATAAAIEAYKIESFAGEFGC